MIGFIIIGIVSILCLIFCWIWWSALDESTKAYERRLYEQERRRTRKRTEKQKFDEEFLQIRTGVLKRDNYTCVNCGRTGGELHVHHIVPRSEGGTNDLDNLVTLCAECHGKQDAKGHQLVNNWESEDDELTEEAYDLTGDIM